MFALAAAFIWFLAAFGVQFGSVNMLLLGLGFFALHLCFPWTPPWPPRPRRG